MAELCIRFSHSTSCSGNFNYNTESERVRNEHCENKRREKPVGRERGMETYMSLDIQEQKNEEVFKIHL